MAAVGSGWLTLRLPGGEPESLIPQRVTAELLRRPAGAAGPGPRLHRRERGRRPRPGRRAERRPLAPPVWRRPERDRPRRAPGRRRRRAEASGGIGYEIVGVMPPEFAYPVGAAARRRTSGCRTSCRPISASATRSSSRATCRVIARLSPGVSLDQARRRWTAGAGHRARQPAVEQEPRVGVLPLVDHIVGAHMRSWMLMLLGAVGIVLLIACANIANLLLARASARQREIGIRATLGARRWRLVRQLLIESLVLSWPVRRWLWSPPRGASRFCGRPSPTTSRASRRSRSTCGCCGGGVAVAGDGRALRDRPGPAELQGRSGDGAQERRSGQHRRRQPATAEPVRGRRGRAGGRAGRRRVALHRQLRVGDAHRSRLRPRERADDSDFAAGRRPDEAARRRAGGRADRRADRPRARCRQRRRNGRQRAARRRPQRRRCSSRGWTSNEAEHGDRPRDDARLPQGAAHPAPPRPLVRRRRPEGCASRS